MIHSSRAGRAAAAIIFVLVVAAVATAGIRWKQWRPLDACLLCGAGEMDVSSTAAGTSGSTLAVDQAPAKFSPLGVRRSTVSSLGSTPTRENNEAAVDGGRRAESSRAGWQAWSASARNRRGFAGNGQGPGTSLGGLFRMMSVVRPGSADSSPSAAVATVARAERPASTRPPRSTPPASRPPASSAAPPASAAPTADFREHEAPLPNPFDQQPPSGPLDPGGPGGGGGGGGGTDLSPNPEPGSLLLIGTGLLGIYGALRRRRLI